ncbi:uncharacterized protein LOC133336618 [Musca vetustissima]|uniref:uncharacterized protein LOC133336618 n=1 Tax=Musca vetustissima TaxID=27455 RepID=UPI002AB7E9D6|nr:uncharacterized protein LOC133336618 [Musca vetustissima]
MRDLCITIVEEHTKRLSRNLALTQTRRRTITFENPPQNKVLEITQPNSKTTIITQPKSLKKSICTTTTTTERSLRPAKNPITSTVTTTTVDVPYKNFKIWTDYDQDENLQLHIKEQKENRKLEDRRDVAMRTI